MPANYVLLERIELNASAASVTFSNIPQTGYTDLKLVVSARTNRSATGDYVLAAFNGSTASFTNSILDGDGTNANIDSTARVIAYGTAATATANTFANSEAYILNYTSANSKTFSSDNVTENNATNAFADIIAGIWANSSAINQITLTPNVGTSFDTNSTFSLYGLAALGTTPAIAPKAAGGNVIATDGTYWYHAFRTSGTFTPQVGLTADVLVIAGGGGGGTSGGGAGAGGLSYQSSRVCTPTNYTVTIGAGGAKGLGNALATNGVNSVFDTITSNGGGAGGSAGSTPVQYIGSNGGSGGGNSYEDQTTSSTSNQGNTGGATGFGTSGGVGKVYGAGDTRAGGGGGAGVAGASGNTSGAGGNGVSTYSSWGSATSTGENVSGTYWYAGGAGGWTEAAARGTAIGGLGGGGAGGAVNVDAVAGTANTGGGGGGGRWDGTNIRTAAGGSGIIIIRYLA